MIRFANKDSSAMALDVLMLKMSSDRDTDNQAEKAGRALGHAGAFRTGLLLSHKTVVIIPLKHNRLALLYV